MITKFIRQLIYFFCIYLQFNYVYGLVNPQVFNQNFVDAHPTTARIIGRTVRLSINFTLLDKSKKIINCNGYVAYADVIVFPTYCIAPITKINSGQFNSQQITLTFNYASLGNIYKIAYVVDNKFIGLNNSDNELALMKIYHKDLITFLKDNIVNGDPYYLGRPHPANQELREINMTHLPPPNQNDSYRLLLTSFIGDKTDSLLYSLVWRNNINIKKFNNILRVDPSVTDLNDIGASVFSLLELNRKYLIGIVIGASFGFPLLSSTSIAIVTDNQINDLKTQAEEVCSTEGNFVVGTCTVF